MSPFHDSRMTKDAKAVEIFHKYIDDKEGKILDVGCGSGSFLKALENGGFVNL
jgi:2-polyprenyl-3-methyl-5-hydroxy-6-metoxy-1,4-benzoquinol methylase